MCLKFIQISIILNNDWLKSHNNSTNMFTIGLKFIQMELNQVEMLAKTPQNTTNLLHKQLAMKLKSNNPSLWP